MFLELFSGPYTYSSFEADEELDESTEEFKKTVIKSLGISPEIFGYTEEELGMHEYEKEEYIE